MPLPHSAHITLIWLHAKSVLTQSTCSPDQHSTKESLNCRKAETLHLTLLLLAACFRGHPSGLSASISPVPNILFFHTSDPHVIFCYICKPSWWSFSFPLTWQLHIQHPLASTSAAPLSCLNHLTLLH